MFVTMSCKLVNLSEGGVSDIVAIDVKGLVNVVPHNYAGDKAKEYCINGLVKGQQLFPGWCRHSLFS